MKILPAILAAVVLLASCQGGHTLFKNGASEYSIVIPEDAPSSVKFAAKELKDGIEAVSGASLPIVERDARGKRINVGIPVYGLDDAEAFAWKSDGDDLSLWGGSDRGTLYAVYDFLEENLGCRWYTSKISVKPHKDKWTFRTLDKRDSPQIRVRTDFLYDAFDTLWAVRNRTSGTFRDSMGGGGCIWGTHTFEYLVPWDKYFTTHPEYFSYVDGTRHGEDGQLCLSNPDVLEMVTGNLAQVMRDNPEYLVYSVTQNDRGNPCQCAECNAIKARYGGTESGILIWFVNQVADALKDEFPDKYVGTFAYQYTQKPPEGIRPADNVVVRLCTIDCCQLHGFDECDANRAALADLQSWSAIAPHLFIWDYIITPRNLLVPMPNLRALQSRVQAFRDNNAIGVMPQGNFQSRGGMFDELKAYVIARLLWNPDIDIDKVSDDFVKGVFGPAARYINEYLKFEEKTLCRPDIHENLSITVESPIFTDEFVRKGREIFKKAYKAVEGDPVYTARVERAELPLCYLQMERNPREGYDAGAMALFDRVVNREGITYIREWYDDRWLEDFRNRMAVAPLMSADCPSDCGDVKLEAQGEYFHLKKAGNPDLALVSQPFHGWNGDTSAYIYIYESAGGHPQACYAVSGTVAPGERYTALANTEWKQGSITMDGFDASKRYCIEVEAVSKELMAFRILPLE